MRVQGNAPQTRVFYIPVFEILCIIQAITVPSAAAPEFRRESSAGSAPSVATRFSSYEIQSLYQPHTTSHSCTPLSPEQSRPSRNRPRSHARFKEARLWTTDRPSGSFIVFQLPRSTPEPQKRYSRRAPGTLFAEYETASRAVRPQSKRSRRSA